MRTPCVHKGTYRKSEQCPTCAGNVEVKVFDCAVHQLCTVAKRIEGISCCELCSDHTVATPTIIAPEEMTEQTAVVEVEKLLEYGPVGPFPNGWKGWENTKHAHINIFQRDIDANHVYPDSKYFGRGIVSCVSAKPGYSSGKHLKDGYLPCAWVMAKELRRLGCRLPITFCHLGHVEWDAALTRLVEPLGVNVIDLREWEKTNRMRILAGWETKIAAILASTFEEALFLDADNVPVRDPSFLFDLPEYKEHGAIFWPDLPPNNRKEWMPLEVWHNFAMEYRNEPDFESGQFLINKRSCWREVMLTRKINEHSDWVYAFVFGDKSTYHLAWAKLNRQYAMPKRGAGWNGGAILQYDLEGKLLFEHCVQNKATLDGYPKGRSCLSNPGECYEHLEELRKSWGGKLWHSEVPLPGDATVMSKMLGKTFVYRRIGLGEREIRLLEDNRIGRGAARCEFAWSIVGGVLSISDIDGKPTMLLNESPDGVWRGAWLDYEKCAVELLPV